MVLFKNLCQSVKITTIKGHKDEDWSGNSYNNIRDIIVLYFKEFVVDISVVT